MPNSQISNILQNSVRQRFELAKERMLSAVLTHPISVEIQSKGRLFGFFGFDNIDDPVGGLMNYLNDFIQIRFGNISGDIIIQKQIRGQGGRFTKDFRMVASIYLPSKSDLRNSSVLRLPWESGKSWPEGVEEGFLNAAQFLPKTAGRSRQGIQVKGNVEAYDYTPRPYLSEIFARFRKEIAFLR